MNWAKFEKTEFKPRELPAAAKDLLDAAGEQRQAKQPQPAKG